MKKLLYMVSIVTLAGCFPSYGPIDSGEAEKEPASEPAKVTLRSYVMGYYDVERIEPLTQKDLSVSDYISTGFIGGSYFRIDLGFVKKGDVATYKDTDPDKKALYDALCEKHGDMGYDSTFTAVDLVKAGMTEFPCFDFVSVDAVSDADLDEAHPAGTSLGDLVYMSWSTNQPYIDNGYDRRSRNRSMLEFINKITTDDLKLISTGKIYYGKAHGCAIYIKLLPPYLLSEKRHNITVSFTTDDGRVFSLTRAFDFGDTEPPPGWEGPWQ